jgi:flagellar biosynthesis protein FlhG
VARPAIVAVASGKGGVGKSVLSANLAVLLARSGRRVTLLDLDLGGADAHLLFGVFHPARTLTDFLERRVDSLGEAALELGAFSNLRLIVGTGETLGTANLVHASKQRLIRHALKLDSDVLIVDVGAGAGLAVLDFFLMADLPLAVATPDGLSAIDLARFLQLAALRRAAAALAELPELRRDLSVRPFATIAEVYDCAERFSVHARAAAQAAVESFRPCLVVNKAREGSRLARFRLTQLVETYLGREFPVLGEIPEDRSVEESVASFLPVVDAAPACRAAAALGEIAREIGRRLDALALPRALAASAGAPAGASLAR